MIYDFNFDHLLPCPFNMSRCQKAVTLALWFRWVDGIKNRYTTFIQMGPGFRLYKAPHPDKKIQFRWINYDSVTWYNLLYPAENEWHHLTALWRPTHTTVYMNGRKQHMFSPHTRPIQPFNDRVSFGSTSSPGEFSTTRMYMWSGAKSPVFIWRLYQDGLAEFRNSSSSLLEFPDWHPWRYAVYSCNHTCAANAHVPGCYGLARPILPILLMVISLPIWAIMRLLLLWLVWSQCKWNGVNLTNML